MQDKYAVTLLVRVLAGAIVLGDWRAIWPEYVKSLGWVIENSMIFESPLILYLLNAEPAQN